MTPDYFSSWGGDLASGIGDVHNLMNIYGNNLDLQKTADALIGGGFDPYPAYFTNNQVSDDDVSFRCNYTDLCDDADSIAIYSMIENLVSSEDNALSTAMHHYYNNITVAYRYSQFEKDGLDYTDLQSLKNSITMKMENYTAIVAFTYFTGLATIAERNAAISSFAKYLYKKVH